MLLFLYPEKHTSGWAPKFSLFLCLSGVKHLGRYHQHPVSGCVALCGSKLRNGSSCLLHSHQGAEAANNHAKQVQSHMRVNYRKSLMHICFLFVVVPACSCFKHLLIGTSSESTGSSSFSIGKFCSSGSCQNA